MFLFLYTTALFSYSTIPYEFTRTVQEIRFLPTLQFLINYHTASKLTNTNYITFAIATSFQTSI